MYGLKYTPRSWYEKINSLFLRQGFMRRKSDPNVYTKFDEQGYIVLTSLYVDDLIITGNVEKLIDEIKEKLSKVFEMKDLGGLHYCLGLEVWRKFVRVSISEKYLRDLKWTSVSLLLFPCSRM